MDASKSINYRLDNLILKIKKDDKITVDTITELSNIIRDNGGIISFKNYSRTP